MKGYALLLLNGLLINFYSGSLPMEIRRNLDFFFGISFDFQSCTEYCSMTNTLI